MPSLEGKSSAQKQQHFSLPLKVVDVIWVVLDVYFVPSLDKVNSREQQQQHSVVSLLFTWFGMNDKRSERNRWEKLPEDMTRLLVAKTFIGGQPLLSN